jgi:hypothetical protein
LAGVPNGPLPSHREGCLGWQDLLPPGSRWLNARIHGRVPWWGRYCTGDGHLACGTTSCGVVWPVPVARGNGVLNTIVGAYDRGRCRHWRCRCRVCPGAVRRRHHRAEEAAPRSNDRFDPWSSAGRRAWVWSAGCRCHGVPGSAARRRDSNHRRRRTDRGRRAMSTMLHQMAHRDRCRERCRWYCTGWTVYPGTVTV